VRTLLLLPFALLAVLTPLAFAACSDKSTPAAATPVDAGNPDAILGEYDPVPFGGSRPVQLYVPSGYTGAPTPLVILLHGYSATGGEEDLYLGLREVAEAKTVLYAHPDGTTDPAGNEFWNATDACCNFYGSTVDDSSYLASLITEFGMRYSVDPTRIYFIGHSNGAFMSYRMACDHADVVAAIVSIAGAMWEDTSRCTPTSPVSVLEVHGTADAEIHYDGGVIGPIEGGTQAATPYPGATTTVADWATFDRCATPPDTSQPPVDIDGNPGTSTSVTQYLAGCTTPTQVNLWTIQNEGHVPGFNSSFAPMAFDFLLAHARPGG
jgi:polyhydroxybutyrate depolymerase